MPYLPIWEFFLVALGVIALLIGACFRGQSLLCQEELTRRQLEGHVGDQEGAFPPTNDTTGRPQADNTGGLQQEAGT